MIDFLTSGPAIIALIILTIAGVMISADNLRFIEIASSKLDDNKKNKANNIGVLVAFLLRIVLAFVAVWILSLKVGVFDFNFLGIHAAITGESLFLIIGGLFLLYKGVTEIHEEVEDRGFDERKIISEQSSSFGKSIWKTTIINTVFAFDIVLLAVGLTNRLDTDMNRVLVLIIIAILLSLVLILVFKNYINRSFYKHPSLHIVGLSFLVLVGFIMLAEGAYLSHAKIFGSEVGALPKNLAYLVIGVSLLFLFINVKRRKENTKGELKK